MPNAEKNKNAHHLKWLILPLIAVIFVISTLVYVSIPASIKPVSNINECIDAGYINKALPTGGWQCTTPDGQTFTE